jgi:acyl carrier protein
MTADQTMGQTVGEPMGQPMDQTQSSAIARLGRIPRPERRGALESLVIQEFKRALLMTEADVLPLDENYFDLGLTSLRASEVKQRLEKELRCELDTALLFGLATVRQVVDHLASVVLPELVVAPPSEREAPAAPAPDLHRQVIEMIADLYES